VRESGEGKKKRKGALVCKPDTLAVTVNKLTERKAVREEDGRARRKGEDSEIKSD